MVAVEEAAEGADAAPAATSRGHERQTRAAWLSTTIIGISLSAAFFPVYFNSFATSDDEGSVLVAIRRFLEHGSLYMHTSNPYGPFYVSFTSLVYKLTGQAPTLYNSRLYVLVVTAVSAGLFAASAYRVTGSKLFAALCQVATYCMLLRPVGSLALHPGPFIALLLSVLSSAPSSYACRPRPAL